MTTLEIQYRHDHLYRPQYLDKQAIAAVAAQVRQQLGSHSDPALSLTCLAAVEELVVNGIRFAVWVDLENEVHDEAGNVVPGVFEFDPGSGENAVSVCVSPQSSGLNPELVLSTLGHEIAHAVFEGPALIAAQQVGNLALDFGTQGPGPARAYRSVTDSGQHLHGPNEHLPKELRIAEYRANEFMGSLLVPEDLLHDVIHRVVPEHALGVKAIPDDSPMWPPLPPEMREIRLERVEYEVDSEVLLRAVAPRFGVNPAFIRTRMKRYGVMPQDAITSA